MLLGIRKLGAGAATSSAAENAICAADERCSRGAASGVGAPTNAEIGKGNDRQHIFYQCRGNRNMQLTRS